MTDQELDRLLRRALLDAADQEAQTPPETETPLSEGLYGNGAGGIVCRRRCEIYKRRWRYDPSQLSVHERWRGQRF